MRCIYVTYLVVCLCFILKTYINIAEYQYTINDLNYKIDQYKNYTVYKDKLYQKQIKLNVELQIANEKLTSKLNDCL